MAPITKESPLTLARLGTLQVKQSIELNQDDKTDDVLYLFRKEADKHGRSKPKITIVGLHDGVYSRRKYPVFLHLMNGQFFPRAFSNKDGEKNIPDNEIDFEIKKAMVAVNVRLPILKVI